MQNRIRDSHCQILGFSGGFVKKLVKHQPNQDLSRSVLDIEEYQKQNQITNLLYYSYKHHDGYTFGPHHE